MNTYKFDCGCEIPIIDEKIKKNDGLPSLCLDYYNLPDCPATWDLICSGKTKGIFQLETNLGQSWSKKILPRSIDEMAALISLLRPGILKSLVDGKSMTAHYADRKSGKEEVEYFHEALKPILKDTYGVLLYQEGLLEIAKQIAGFNLQEADILRKCIAKGSLVYTHNGPRKIEDLVNNGHQYKILSIDKNNRLKYYPIKNVWSNGFKNIHNLRTTNGDTLGLTANHQIFTQNGWKALQNLDINDYIVSPNLLYNNCRLTSIKSIEHIGQKEVFDFCLEEEPHAGFINGILVHNSVGKKDVKLMSQVKTKFIEGCQKTQIVTDKEAEEIFGWIEKSQKYSFNRSITLNTLVNTSKNIIKTIEELEVGEYIDSPNGYVQVLNKFDHGIQDVYEVELQRGGKIQCTLPHKFLCSDKKIRPLYEIVLNNHHISPFTYYMHNIFIISKDGTEKICSFNKLGQKQTIDIEVNHPSHLYYANKIATSNSHGVGYGMLGYWSAYVKAHFPFHFFTSWLHYAKEKLDPQTETKLLISDSKNFDIPILPPSILSLNSNFSLNDEKIRFGINNIKKIGLTNSNKLIKLVEKIEEKLGKPIKEWSWYTFLYYIDIASTTMNGLIQVGAFNHLGISRTRLLFEYDIWRKLTKKEKSNLANYETLFEALQALLDSKLNINRRDIVQNLIKSLQKPPSSFQDTTYKIISWENDLLGVPLTYNKIDNCKDNLRSLANTTCISYPNAPNKDIIIAGELTRVTTHKIKEGANSGQEMAFLSLEDETGSLENIIAFPEIWVQYQHLLYEENTVLLMGYKSSKGGFVIKTVKNL